MPTAEMPQPRTPPWKRSAFEAVTDDFPHMDTRDLALKVMDGILDAFRGDRTKAVCLKAPKHNAEDVQLLRENFQKGMALGFQAGPFDQPAATAHPCARPSNVVLVPKHPLLSWVRLRHQLLHREAHCLH